VSRSAWASLALVSVVLGVAWWLSRRPEPPTAQAPPPPPPQDPNEIKATIDRANAECIAALERGDARAYARHFAEDSISLPGRGPMVVGRPAIEEAMSEAFSKVQFEDAEWRTLETRFQGKTAYETGAYKFVVKPFGKGRAQEEAGRYFVVWKRVGDEWKIAVDAAQPGAPVD
jgi:uncharacterized protein (TIGR02246 family)